MDVLVTGGCGYIGSAILRQLQAHPDVDSTTVLDSLRMGSPRNLLGARIYDGFNFKRGDVTEYGDVESALRDVDAVVHLAAITGAESTHDRRAETFETNFDGAKNVFTAAAKLDVDNVVFASSCNIYGRTPSTEIDETVEPAPLNPYAESKYEAENLLTDFIAENAFDGTALRLSTNYGYAPGIRFNLVVNTFVFRALTGRPLTVYGDGSNWRPFIHVEDAARAFMHAVCNPTNWPQNTYNVGAAEENYRITEIAEIVQQAAPTDVEINYIQTEKPGPSYHVDFTRLSETGFQPDWSLREGVHDLIERFTRENPRQMDSLTPLNRNR